MQQTARLKESRCKLQARLAAAEAGEQAEETPARQQTVKDLLNESLTPLTSLDGKAFAGRPRRDDPMWLQVQTAGFEHIRQREDLLGRAKTVG